MRSEASASDLAALIDHTILKPDATETEVARYCAEALDHAFAAVCVNSIHVPLVAGTLRGSAVRTCSVIGFPLGAVPSALKAREAEWAVAAGAGEIDMVIDVGGLKDGSAARVREDVAAVKRACGGALLKVITENGLLDENEKEWACRLAIEAGADFVKTSTGFSAGGASVADVALMRRIVGPSIGVKASGGIRSRADALAMIAAGASRLGTSASVSIVSGDRDEEQAPGTASSRLRQY